MVKGPAYIHKRDDDNGQTGPLIVIVVGIAFYHITLVLEFRNELLSKINNAANAGNIWNYVRPNPNVKLKTKLQSWKYIFCHRLPSLSLSHGATLHWLI